MPLHDGFALVSTPGQATVAAQRGITLAGYVPAIGVSDHYSPSAIDHLKTLGQASNELCSIRWASNFDITLDWRREIVNR
jgi:hypothetical protein